MALEGLFSFKYTISRDTTTSLKAFFYGLIMEVSESTSLEQKNVNRFGIKLKAFTGRLGNTLILKYPPN